MTGLLAGLGVAIALGKEIDPEWIRFVLCALIAVAAAVGGTLTGAIAAGCYRDEGAREDGKLDS